MSSRSLLDKVETDRIVWNAVVRNEASQSQKQVLAVTLDDQSDVSGNDVGEQVGECSLQTRVEMDLWLLDDDPIARLG